jgi:hypothetical protein
MVLGLVRVRHGVTVMAGDLADVAGLAKASSADAADLVVVIDGGRVADAELASALAQVRQRIGDAGTLALAVASPVTEALLQAARGLEHGDDSGVARAMGTRDDAYARAMRWASERARASNAPIVPAIDPERLARIAEHASAAGLTLVEDVTAAGAHGLSSARGLRTPHARALLATVALGSGAWPLMLVPSRRAPKGGLARAKRERLADAWVSAGAGSALGTGSTESELVRVALAVLDETAAAGRGPLSFKELLRESRERWTAHARARGGRATPGSGDAAALAEALYRFAASENVMLYAMNPCEPGWTLTLASSAHAP